VEVEIDVTFLAYTAVYTLWYPATTSMDCGCWLEPFKVPGVVTVVIPWLVVTFHLDYTIDKTYHLHYRLCHHLNTSVEVILQGSFPKDTTGELNTETLKKWHRMCPGRMHQGIEAHQVWSCFCILLTSKLTSCQICLSTYTHTGYTRMHFTRDSSDILQLFVCVW
jgi:hypothetical protein